MSTSPRLQKQERFSYADYLTWPDDERWELIDGVAYMMSPAPSRIHQKVSAALFNQIYNHLKGKPCESYSAPFDVRLPGNAGAADDDIDTVVQPDIVVVCDHHSLRLPYFAQEAGNSRHSTASGEQKSATRSRACL